MREAEPEAEPTSVAETSVTPDLLRSVMAEFASGVTVVSTHWRGADHAITATAFCSVSLDPPLVLVCVGKASRFHPVIAEADAWAVSLLSHNQGWVGRHFADRERDLSTQFSQVPHTRASRSRAPLPTGSQGWLDCTTYARYDGGDHTIVVGRVVEAGAPSGAHAPLTYHRASYSDTPSGSSGGAR